MQRAGSPARRGNSRETSIHAASSAVCGSRPTAQAWACRQGAGPGSHRR
ncbi:hypothetical protein ISF6_1539 [Piscinibacter sakaiensis]|uniref:Uncharacterized protein n=1 Tax=Piscinibacter sakaiensis TaxID=1547922 RepID=A0A0K8NZF5_PISS1|nr:hypothetical protein ISF6_1539 [Piscinibacter sakaiensis]